ncbi:organic solute transporter OST-alpha [Tanacetum coccineum]
MCTPVSPCFSDRSFSFISLLNPSISVDIEILRDCYEAFAMYCFGRYLVACLGTMLALSINEVDEDSEDDEEVCVVTSVIRERRGEGTSKGLPKKPRHKGPIDMFFARKPEDVLTGGRNMINFENEWGMNGGENRAIEFLEREGRAGLKTPLLEQSSDSGMVKHIFPMNLFLKPWRLGQRVYLIIKIGIVQYMIIKAVTAVLAVILEAFDVYCEGNFKWGCGYPYMAVVLNFSQSWALYCLVMFYEITADELAHIHPLAKFLTFKSIVFLTWWQGIAIALLCSFGLVRSPIAQALHFQSSIQDFIICIELIDYLCLVATAVDGGGSGGVCVGGGKEDECMGIASIVHLYVFPSKPYELMGDLLKGDVSVLGDYASTDCPVDPDEVRDSERPTKLRLPQPDDDVKSRTAIRESVRDVFVGGGEYIVAQYSVIGYEKACPIKCAYGFRSFDILGITILH